MRATVYVASTPYVNIADDRGRFTFEHVVPGEYKAAGFAEGAPIEKIAGVAGPLVDVSLR